ncbi:hypothetical protein FEI15_07985 [Lacticaseibacillus zeae]|uniref:Uncharacterized protein n=1 Tax=Lacticaseibacillus zeae TaxID=57037 RepID=A0A5R8M1R1_LACZE|nr:hypothetical protein FEI15_07985 [Lacticaseibacillus zeae]TLF43516.1 hypothetical protein FEI14_01150 [Lacticaseibacillus zeae]
MAGLWPFRSEVLMCRFLGLRARFHGSVGTMARSWPLRLRSLHVDFCASERVRGSIGQTFLKRACL